MEVAPLGFGDYGGRLIAPDEYSGNIYAVGADGASSLVVKSGLPTGADIGVESVGFVPRGFSSGGTVFYADRATAGNPHPGTDSLLTLSSTDLTGASIEDGDLFAVTEGGATAIGVRCDHSTCSILPVVSQPTRAHGEGHVVFTVEHPPAAASPTPDSSPTPAVSATPAAKSAPQSPAAVIAIVIVLVVLGAGALAVVRARWRA